MRQVFSIVFMSFLCFLSCANQEDSHDHSLRGLERAYWYIDHDQSEKAIGLLQPLVKANPQDENLRVGLASAHVSEAGISLKEFLFLAEGFLGDVEVRRQQAEERHIRWLKFLQDQSDEATVELVRLAGLFYQAIAHWAALSEVYARIPEVTSPEKLVKLNLAIDELSKLNALRPSTSLYRGLLKLIRFKFELKNNTHFKVEVACQLEVVQVSNAFDDVFTDLSEIMQDIAMGFPKKSQQLLEARSQLMAGHKQFMQALEDLSIPRMNVRYLLVTWLGSSLLRECQ